MAKLSRQITLSMSSSYFDNIIFSTDADKVQKHKRKFEFQLVLSFGIKVILK